MIDFSIDEADLRRQLTRLSSEFGEEFQDGVIRWGVATARRLAVETQAFGDDAKKTKTQQQGAIMFDAHKGVVVVNGAEASRKLMRHALTYLKVNGEWVEFRPYQNVTTAAGVNLFLDAKRRGRDKRVIKMPVSSMILTTRRIFDQAMRARWKNAGEAKGGWIGAGIALSKNSTKGRRITIGRNFLNYAHKFKSRGSATFKKSIWDPEATITNSVPHASSSYVISSGKMLDSIHKAGVMVVKEYEQRMQKRLNRRK